jgi:hypothetical protein
MALVPTEPPGKRSNVRTEAVASITPDEPLTRVATILCVLPRAAPSGDDLDGRSRMALHAIARSSLRLTFSQK